MTTPKTLTLSLEPELHLWLETHARARAQTLEALVATLVREERERSALEAVAAWARDDEGAPTDEEIDRVRESLLAGEASE
ncbi:MAG: hypothetical protein U0325_07965 [Polyangiales bacterium]